MSTRLKSEKFSGIMFCTNHMLEALLFASYTHLWVGARPELCGFFMYCNRLKVAGTINEWHILSLKSFTPPEICWELVWKPYTLADSTHSPNIPIIMLPPVQGIIEQGPTVVPEYSSLPKLQPCRTTHCWNWILHCGLHCFHFHSVTRLRRNNIFSHGFHSLHTSYHILYDICRAMLYPEESNCRGQGEENTSSWDVWIYWRFKLSTTSVQDTSPPSELHWVQVDKGCLHQLFITSQIWRRVTSWEASASTRLDINFSKHRN